LVEVANGSFVALQFQNLASADWRLWRSASGKNVELRPWLRQNQTNLNVCYQDTFFAIGEFTVSVKIYFFDGPLFGEPEFNL